MKSERTRRFKRIVPMLAMCLLAGTLAGCRQNAKEETYPVDEGYLYGMCYISYEMHRNDPEGYQKTFEILHNMGVKSVRLWMHMTWFLDGEFKVREENVQAMKDMIAEAQKYGFQLIGMSHRNINKYYDDGTQYHNAKIGRDSEYYDEWIDGYYRGWKWLAETFPEITIWEIDNETNNPAFMMNAETGEAFTLQEMAEISTDLFYYGSKGVHEANPDATTVMGGLVTWGGVDEFLTMLYQNIGSGLYGEGSTDPDDYFQALCWHPYLIPFEKDEFIRMNQEIYDLCYSFEGKHKKVFLTEAGDFDWKRSEETAAAEVTAIYEAVKELPFVESLHYHRMYDNIPDNNRQGGLFYDPNPNHKDVIDGVRQNPGKPKLSAYAFQEVAGGEGPLDLLEVDLTP